MSVPSCNPKSNSLTPSLPTTLEVPIPFTVYLVVPLLPSFSKTNGVKYLFAFIYALNFETVKPLKSDDTVWSYIIFTPPDVPS